MDVYSNSSHIIFFDGHVELAKYRYLYFSIFLTVYLLIVVCNFMIVYLIWSRPNLHEPMYVFIAALLINTVFWSTFIYPKLLIDFLSEKQVISLSACLLQFYMFYSSGGSELLLLAAMAYDRYVSICEPLRYSVIMKKSAVCALLAAAWLLPASQIAVSTCLTATRKLCEFTLEGFLCNNTIFKLQCTASRVQFLIDMVILSNVALFPLLFIGFTYTRILMVAYRNSGDVRAKAAQTCLPHIIVLINLYCLCAFDVAAVYLDSILSRTLRFAMTLQLLVYHPVFNPIIYGLKMKEISKHLRRFLHIRPSRSVAVTLKKPPR